MKTSSYTSERKNYSSPKAKFVSLSTRRVLCESQVYPYGQVGAGYSEGTYNDGEIGD